MRALVTGASGFIGRTLCDKLIQRGDGVRGFARQTSRIDQLKQMGVQICYGDLTDLDSLKQATRGVDVIYHSAAHVGDWGTREQFYQGNVAGTRHVLEALLDAGVPRLVYISSVAVYGRQAGDIHENTPRRKTGDPYVDTKIAAEEAAMAYAAKHRFALTVIRPSLIYGPYDYKFVPRVAANLRKGRMMIMGSGRNRAPLVYGEDVADLAILAVEHESATGEIFIASSGEPVSWNQFLSTLAEYLKLKPPKLHVPVPLAYALGASLESLWKLAGSRRPPMVTRFAVRLLGTECRYDITKAQKVLGYQPKVFYEEGLRKTLDWMQANSSF